MEVWSGDEFVYAYGYRCAPDRLKIGKCAGDVVARVAAQISTGTPDKPMLLLRTRTHDCGALERILHGMFRLKRRQVAGAGAEWFMATRDEVLAAFRARDRVTKPAQSDRAADVKQFTLTANRPRLLDDSGRMSSRRKSRRLLDCRGDCPVLHHGGVV